MRLDKYLKISRIIKRRTVASDACSTSHVSVNGKVVKPSYDLKLGDEIEIRFGDRLLRVRVTDLSEHVQKQNASNMYEVLS